MGYGTDGLTFNTLRGADRARLPQFKDANGNRAHSKDDGSDWSPGEWVCAVTGELGELANVIKKVKIGDLTMDQARPEISKELADVAIYLDLLAMQCGVDLGEAIIEKFNEVSERVKSSVRIDHEGWHHVR